jgi:hypothetical protein
MRSGTRAGVQAVVLAAALSGPAASPASANGDALELQVLVHAALDPADFAIARQTAGALLATAEIPLKWGICAGRCDEPSGSRPALRVLLLPIAKRDDSSVCGDVIRHPDSNVPSIIVYVAGARDIASAIRRSSVGRAHPELATVTTGHVVGLTIAHEIGHVLGLRHRSSGPMKARPDSSDISALRASRLRFARAEVRTMRVAVTTGGMTVAQGKR